MTFIIDTRELGAEYIDHLKRSHSITFKTLESADIVFSCLGIERKINLAEKMLCAIPGVSANNAFSLLKHFGTLNQVLLADKKALSKTPGIGTKKADSIVEAVNQIRL